MIVAMLYLVGLVVFLLFMLWLTTRKTDATAQIQVEYLDELAGGDPAFSDGRDFQEPSAEDLQDLAVTDPTEMLTAITDVASTVEAGAQQDSGGSYESRSGERRRAGQGGNASVPRWERWEVRFNTTSLGAYGKQLDSLDIELGAVGGGRDQIDYAADFGKATPSRRAGPTAAEKRLYMSYRSGQLKEFDRQLLAKAGIPTRNRMVLQFYPRNLENTLASLEMQKAGGRPLKSIRKTVFSLRKAGNRYQFEVTEQRYK